MEKSEIEKLVETIVGDGENARVRAFLQFITALADEPDALERETILIKATGIAAFRAPEVSQFIQGFIAGPEGRSPATVTR